MGWLPHPVDSRQLQRAKALLIMALELDHGVDRLFGLTPE
jgi:hypothetical protein